METSWSKLSQRQRHAMRTLILSTCFGDDTTRWLCCEDLGCVVGQQMVARGFYVVGGLRDEEPTLRVWLWQGDQNSLRELYHIPEGRAGCAAVTLHGKLYAIGGYDSREVDCERVDVYSPDLNTWRMLCFMNVGRSLLAAAAIPSMDCIIIVGGGKMSCDIVYDSTCRVNVRTGECVTVAPMKKARWALGVAVLDDMVYAVGGADALGWTRAAVLSSCERYDPKSDTWTTVAPMSVARCALGVAACRGVIYAAGGYDGDRGTGVIEVYDPRVDAWSTLPHAMPIPRFGFGMINTDGVLCCVGGCTDTGYENTMYTYDVVRHTWDTMPSPFRLRYPGVTAT